jgi:hypothetical protein
MKTRNYQKEADELLQDLVGRLDNEEPSCTQEYWLQMPTMGFIAASAFNRPVIILTPSDRNCYSFFPYRTPPNKEPPTVLAFVDQIHFVSLGLGDLLVPFPEVYGQVRNAEMLESTQVPKWIEQYRTQLDRWALEYPAVIG